MHLVTQARRPVSVRVCRFCSRMFLPPHLHSVALSTLLNSRMTHSIALTCRRPIPATAEKHGTVARPSPIWVAIYVASSSSQLR